MEQANEIEALRVARYEAGFLKDQARTQEQVEVQRQKQKREEQIYDKIFFEGGQAGQQKAASRNRERNKRQEEVSRKEKIALTKKKLPKSLTISARSPE